MLLKVKCFVFIGLVLSSLVIPTSAFASTGPYNTSQLNFQVSNQGFKFGDKEDFASWCKRNGYEIEESDKIWQRWFSDWKWEDFCNWTKELR